MELTLPVTQLPREDPIGLWSMQLNLLKLAEAVLGPRDNSKVIYQPAFVDDGPHIRNTPNFDGAFAELSQNAGVYWPTVVNELAHETVHLLNPSAGVGNWLSEGMAVAFSIYAQRCYRMEPQSIGIASYRRSLELVSELPPNPLTAGQHIRVACESLDNATGRILESLFPSVDSKILIQLCKAFERAWS